MRAALYERVSTEEQERYGLSLSEQSRTLKEYANSHDMSIAGEYIDGGISARKRYIKRPALMRLLDDVRENKIDTILFIKLDRWFRNVADYYEVQKVLDEYGVTWRATEEDYETETASGRFKVNIMLSVAQDEADRTSERIKFVQKGKRERNEPVSGNVPLGYKIENKKLVIDGETEPLVRKAMQIYKETGSPGSVIDGVPELKFNYEKIYRMISSTAYKGEYSGMTVPAYISVEEWNQLQTIRSHITRKTKHNRVYLFTGLISCPICGGRMAGCYGKEGRSKYRCGRHARKTGCNFQKSVQEKYIEDYLLSHIDSKIQITIKAKPAGKSYQSERISIQKKLSRLSELYINDLISIKDYRAQYDKLQDELKAVPADRPDAGKLKEKFFPDWKEMYFELPMDGKRAFWHASIESISLNVDGSINDFSFAM